MSYIVGADDLLRQLGAIGNIDVSDSIADWTDFIRDEAKHLAPVESGDLRDSIDSEITHDADTVTGSAYTDIVYGPAVELGIGQEAQPYLYPAVNNNINRITDGIAADIGAKIEEVAGNG